MIVKEIHFGDDGQKKLKSGIKKIAGAVKSTMGARGRTVLIESENHIGGITVTKDGVTVARSINLYDPTENLAVMMMRQAADRTAVVAGDGTTTAIVLAESIIDNADNIIDSSDNVTEVIREISEITTKICSRLSKMSKKLSGKKLLDVATISANNDREVGKMIADTFGKVNVVTVENSQTPSTHVEIISGMKIDRGFSSKYFITDQKKQECVLDNPYVLITDHEISNILNIEKVIAHVISSNKSLLIIGQLSAINGQRLTVQNTRQDGARDLADARNALSKAQTLLAQRQVLFDKGIIARAAIDPVREDVAYQQARVATLQRGTSEAAVTLAAQSSGIAATSQQLRESLAMVRASLSALVLRAPVGGRLTAFTLQPGQMLKSGDPVGQIDSEGQWKLIADVDQFYLGRVHTGLGAVADLDGRSYPMTLLKVLPQVTAGRFRVELAFRTSPPVALNRGQTLDVRLILGADRPAIVAPSGGWLDAGGTMAFVLDGDSKAVRRAIVTGRRNPDQVEVISGLAPGDRIVTTALTSYAPFQTLLLK